MATTEVPLYRSVRKDEFENGVIVDGHAVTGVLYPQLVKKTFYTQDGQKRTRQPDVTPYEHEGKLVVDPGGGTSLFDRNRVFGSRDWHYFTLPKGTVVPDSLRVRFTGHNDKFNADHYQIEAAAQRMPVDALKGALDNLARNAVEKSVRDSRGA